MHCPATPTHLPFTSAFSDFWLSGPTCAHLPLKWRLTTVTIYKKSCDLIKKCHAHRKSHTVDLRVLTHSNKLITFNHKNADSMVALIAHSMFTITACALYLISCGCAHRYTVLPYYRNIIFGGVAFICELFSHYRRGYALKRSIWSSTCRIGPIFSIVNP